MVGLVITGLCMLFLVILFLFTKLSITVHYHRKHEDDFLMLRFKVWGVYIYTYTVPFISFEKAPPTLKIKRKKKTVKMKKQEAKKRMTIDEMLRKTRILQHFMGNIKGFHRVIKGFSQHVTVNQFEWHTCIGLGDAALTGMATGTLWILKGNVVSLIEHDMKMAKKPGLSIEQAWQSKKGETDLNCMISFRIGHAMGAVLQIVKDRKGGSPHARRRASY